MSIGPEPKKPRARGKALPRSSVDIDRMAEVTDGDIAAARLSWRARVPFDAKTLIDAIESTEDEDE